jgi:hypothetical protein
MRASGSQWLGNSSGVRTRSEQRHFARGFAETLKGTLAVELNDDGHDVRA